MYKRILTIAGAYVSWVIGSGFATGQELLQFFTSYGLKSYLLLLINLIGFVTVGSSILKAAEEHKNDENYDPYIYFCGPRLGRFYSFFLPICVFAGMVILISGAGTTLHEYYQIPHNAGAFLLAFLAFLTYCIGFSRFVKIASVTGPAIIAFTLIVGLLTMQKTGLTLTLSPTAQTALAASHPVPFFWLAGFLYISYNLFDGSRYFSALGQKALSPKEAILGAATGSIALMAAIFLMNTAMLSHAKEISALGIPTLYLARKISPILGLIFCITLILGIFASSSAMLWTICQPLTKQGTPKSYAIAALLALAAFLLGLLPFSNLISIAYTASGYIGLPFILCAALKYIRPKK